METTSDLKWTQALDLLEQAAELLKGTKRIGSDSMTRDALDAMDNARTAVRRMSAMETSRDGLARFLEEQS